MRWIYFILRWKPSVITLFFSNFQMLIMGTNHSPIVLDNFPNPIQSGNYIKILYLQTLFPRKFPIRSKKKLRENSMHKIKAHRLRVQQCALCHCAKILI